MEFADVTLWLAFVAGFLSFVSPCNLPLYPSYLSYITGVSVKDLKDEKGMFQRRAIVHTIFFIIGFSIVFFALGLSASWLGNFFSYNQELISQLGGILIIAMGLVMVGLLNPRLLMRDKRLKFNQKPVGHIGSVLVGITYAAGWTPCVGPILTAVIAMGITQPEKSIFYISAYTLGFALPFFIMAFFIGRVKWILKYSNMMMKIGGGLMILTGILLFTGQLNKITIYLIQIFGGFTGF